MLTLIVYAVVALIVVGALVVLAVLVLPGTEQLAPAPSDRAPWSLPADRAMVEQDVATLKLPVTLRGYRFAETDAVLDRLGAEIDQRDQVIADLRARLALPPAIDMPVESGAPVPEPIGAPADESSEPLAESGPVTDEPLTELGETPEDTDGPVRGDALVEPVAAAAPAPVVVAIDEDFGVDDVELDDVPAPAADRPDRDLGRRDSDALEPPHPESLQSESLQPEPPQPEPSRAEPLPPESLRPEPPQP